MPTNPNRTTAVAGGNQQLIAGHLAHFRITFRNKVVDDHRRWPGVVFVDGMNSEPLIKGITYAVVSVADGDKNLDWSGMGFKDFSEPYTKEDGTDDYYRTMTGIEPGYTGEVQRGKFFTADDGDKNIEYFTRMNISGGLGQTLTAISPGTDLEANTAYTIHTIGGAVDDNDFSGQFANIDSAAEIRRGFTFVVETGELDHFTEANGFHADTRLVKGDSLTVLAYGSDFFKDGELEPSNAMMGVIHALQNFASVVQVGPLVISEETATEPKKGSVVVVLENHHGDLTDEGMNSVANQIRTLLGRTFDSDVMEIETGASAELEAGVTYTVKEFVNTTPGTTDDWTDLGAPAGIPRPGDVFTVGSANQTFTAADYGTGSKVTYEIEPFDVEVFELR